MKVYPRVLPTQITSAKKVSLSVQIRVVLIESSQLFTDLSPPLPIRSPAKTALHFTPQTRSGLYCFTLRLAGVSQPHVAPTSERRRTSYISYW